MRKGFALLACLVASAALCSGIAQANDAALDALKKGGHVLLMRHAQTVSGIGDPPEFKLGECKTQRNLSQEGRDAAKALGDRLRSAGVKFDAVYSSAWCRCVDTAQLVMRSPEVFAALNSTFSNAADAPLRAETVRNKIRAWKGLHNIALVTHMLNIQAISGEVLGMNEVIVLKPAPQTKEGFVIVGRLAQ
jgi:broad specificity phosphatase PhoE